MQFMVRETCYFAGDYDQEIRDLGDPAKMTAATKVVQFPYAVSEVAEKTEAELAAALERRREQGKRLQEMQSRQRLEKVAVRFQTLLKKLMVLDGRKTGRAGHIQSAATPQAGYGPGRLRSGAV